MKHLVFLCIFFFAIIKLHAQDYHADFVRIRNSFNIHDQQLAFDIAFRYYASPTSTTCSDSMKGRYVLQGNQYWYQLGQLEMMRNQFHYILLDKSERKISIEKSDKGQSPYSFELIDSFLQQIGAVITALPANGHLKGYLIAGLVGDVTDAQIWFDDQSYRISKIVLQFSRQQIDDQMQDPLVVINYSNYHFQSQSDAFSEKRYVTRIGLEWQPAEAYRNYHLIDHTM